MDYQTGDAAIFSTAPLVADGVMYVTAPFSHVIALDAKRGRQIWRYDHKRTSDKICCGPANRGAALGYGRVLSSLSMDASSRSIKRGASPCGTGSGREGDGRHQIQAAADDPLHARNITGSTGAGAVIAPLVYEGKVFVRITGFGYGLHLDSPRPGAPLGAVVGVPGRYGHPGVPGCL